MKNNTVFTRKSDIIIIAVIILAAAGSLLFRHLVSSERCIANISVNEKTISVIDLSKTEDGEFKLKEIQGPVFEIKDGKIRIKSSDCKNQICVNTGFIASPGETIVCLPKKLVIEIKDGKALSSVKTG